MKVSLSNLGPIVQYCTMLHRLRTEIKL